MTGCAGFIGSAVCRLLLAQGHAVLGADNVDDNYDPVLKRWRLKQLEGQPGFAWRETDIRDRASVTSLFAGRKFDAVINLAARAGVRQSLERPWDYYETNVRGVLNILDACRNNPGVRLVQASTSSVYAGNEGQFSEDDRTDRPLSPYAASKKAAEELCYSYHRLYGIDVTVLRFFTVYGPAGRPDMSIFRFIRWTVEGEPLVLYGDGSQSRDFTFVDDVARAVAAAAGRTSGYSVINVGSDRPADMMRVIRTIESQVGKKAVIERRPAHPADQRATWADITLARRLLGWEPGVSLEEGIKQSVDWYQANRSWARLVQLQESPSAP